MPVYKDIKIGDWVYREFKSTCEPEDLHWHKDVEDRLVSVIKAGDWKFQLDNKLPSLLVSGQILTIPKHVWHRVILGSSSLLLKFKYEN